MKSQRFADRAILVEDCRMQVFDDFELLAFGLQILADRQNLASAVEKLQGSGLTIKRASSVYETEPMYVREQRPFLNMVVEVETELFPMVLLSRIQKVELALGRRRGGIENGPRTIDIDILFYGGSTVRVAKLEIPHPRMAERRFVLAPLADLAPDLRHPVTGLTVCEMLEAAPPQTVRLINS